MSMSAVEPESELLRQAIEGDRASLAQLLLVHYDSLHRHIRARIPAELQGLVRSEDVLQQTFVRTAEAIANFQARHDQAFRGWLQVIADNLVRDACKRRRRERRAGEGGPSTMSSPLHRLIGAQTSPSRRAMRGEAIRDMKTALTHLPSDQQDVLRRRYFLGQSLDEIAAETGRTKDGVRSLCFRARKSLRAAMGRTSLYFSQ